MMNSNLLSRLLPLNPQGRSIYDDLRAHDEEGSDIEERAGLALDEQNLGFRDDELGDADVFGEDSRMTTESTAFIPTQHQNRQGARNNLRINSQDGRSKWMAQSPRLLEEDGDDEVPMSLLIEGHGMPVPSSPVQPRVRQPKARRKEPAIPGPSNRETRSRWETALAQQQLHQDDAPAGPRPIYKRTATVAGSPRDKAMWNWVNVMNVDNFIHDVYYYYTGSGMYCILLQNALNLAQTTFVAVFTTFLTQCVNYNKIPTSIKLSQVMVPQCTQNISGMPNVAIWLFTLYVFWRIWLLLASIPHLRRMRDFYLCLLDVPDSDMQTISWQEVVARIMALRDSNPATAINVKVSPSARRWLGSQSKKRLDAHDIANRLMRKENYLIALFNKDILDLTLPFPFFHGRQMFSRTMLWNLDQCIMGLLFHESGQVRQLVLKDTHRRQLIDALRSRFMFAGFMNMLFAPIIVAYFVVVYFFKYFKEYQKNPSAIGSRQYTPLAEWKFREFNELDHLFHKRINMSYPFASRYLDQFPKVKSVQFARFVAFIAGAVVAVLALATLWDPELFLSFEITPSRTALFYLGVFGPLWAIMNGSIPEDNLVFEPEYTLRNVIDYTHYMPNHWQDRLHSDDVRKEFATLYQMKIVIFIEEIISIILTPFVLWFSLPKCSEQIIDFFREFTVHVDGVGYVCSFAHFNFQKGDNRKEVPPHARGQVDPRDEYYSTKDGKMAASYFGFLDNYLLNPKTAVQGHIPPGTRQFHPPPSFPGLMSPTLNADMQTSRMGRSERRPGSRAPGGNGPPAPGRAPRFPLVGAHASPMQSILLDPHHQPSTSGFGPGARSVRRNSRSRYRGRQDIIEEPQEGEEEESGVAGQSSGHNIYESTVGLDESRWETEPQRGMTKEGEEDEADSASAGGGGVLGLLYQFQKAQTEGRPGVNMI